MENQDPRREEVGLLLGTNLSRRQELGTQMTNKRRQIIEHPDIMELVSIVKNKINLWNMSKVSGCKCRENMR